MIKTYDVVEIFYYKGKKYSPAWLMGTEDSPNLISADPDEPFIKYLIDAGFLKERE